MRGEFVDLGGVRLYYYAAGSRGAGEPVVLLHGFGTSGHLWHDVVSLAPPGHRLVVVDLLGYGRSDPPRDRTLSLRSHAERVVLLLDALGISAACIVGHGLGGGVAQALALDWPSRVTRLALISSVAFRRWMWRDVVLARATLPLTRRLPPQWLLSMVRSELERGFADATRASHSIDKFLRPFSSADGRNALVRHIAALDPKESAHFSARLGEIDVPTAVVWGSDDPFLSPHIGQRLANAISGASFDLVQGARHFVPDDAPRQLSDALQTLLSR